MDSTLLHFWIIISMASFGTGFRLRGEDVRRCYVCGRGSDVMFRDALGQDGGHHQPDSLQYPPSCLDFDQSASRGQFIRECPPGYQSCLTQVDGNEVVRTCENLVINDCQNANGVSYCYCTGDLCNSNTVKPVLASEADKLDLYVDDEDDNRSAVEEYGHDDIESSGRGPVSPSTEPVTTAGSTTAANSSRPSTWLTAMTTMTTTTTTMMMTTSIATASDDSQSNEENGIEFAEEEEKQPPTSDTRVISKAPPQSRRTTITYLVVHLIISIPVGLAWMR